jgi:bifunctional non-homologous end joining protein LigD
LLHAALDALELRSFLKTSGGKGLHVVVPLTPREDWAAVKAFSHALVRHMVRHASDRFVAKSGPRNRVGRIFIDYLRNSRGGTTVAAFSPRARPGLSISLPLAWDDLPQFKSSAVASISTPLSHLAEAQLAWSDYPTVKQTLTRARKSLGLRSGGD